jgi:hypothetical protein
MMISSKDNINDSSVNKLLTLLWGNHKTYLCVNDTVGYFDKCVLYKPWPDHITEVRNNMSNVTRMKNYYNG